MVLPLQAAGRCSFRLVGRVWGVVASSPLRTGISFTLVEAAEDVVILKRKSRDGSGTGFSPEAMQ